MWFNHKKPEYVDLRTFNEKLKETKDWGMALFICDPHDENIDSLRANAYTWVDGRENQHLLYTIPFSNPKKTIHVCLDLFDLKARENDERRAYDLYRRYLQPLQKKHKENIQLPGNEDYINLVTEQYQWIDLELEERWRKCWSYDVNSCFLSFLDKPLPTDRMTGQWRMVKENEIGFADEDGYLIMKRPGQYARWIFGQKTYKSLSEFKKVMYHLKDNAPTEEEKADVKEAIVKTIGYLKYRNVFLRSAILHYAKEYILKYKDENTVYCNTDSIVSTVPRSDITLSQECGGFKMDHENEWFVYRSIGIYVWHGERMKYKGMKRSQVKHKNGEYYVERNFSAFLDIDKRKMVKVKRDAIKEVLWQDPQQQCGEDSQ